MAKNKDSASEPSWSLSRSVQEASQTIADKAAMAQERNVKFVQGVFEHGVELLKSHAEDTRALMQELMEHPGKPQGTFQAVAESAVAAQDRNMKFAQSFVQSSSDTLRAHVESTRTLTQELAEQAKRQQEAFQVLTRETVDAYVDFLYTPFSYYEQTLDTVESIAWQGMETAQKIVRQGLEVAQKAAHQEKQATR
jgi:hypothetical protein